MSKSDSEMLGLIDDLIDRDMSPLVIQAKVRRHGYRVDIEWVRRRRAEREVAAPRKVEPLVNMQTEHEAAFRRVVARVGTLRARELVDELERLGIEVPRG
jgi:hypothetical protein